MDVVDDKEENVNNALDLAWTLLNERELREEIEKEHNNESEKTIKNLLKKYGLPESAKSRLFNIISLQKKVEFQKKGKGAHTKAQKTAEDEFSQQIQDTVLESFKHIRYSFWVSITMSVILFLVGMCFLIITVTRSFAEANVSTTTLTIAGLGIADFVLLFYTRPWQDVSANLSNSQKIRMIALSYLAGIPLTAEGEEERLKSLEHYTTHSIELLKELPKKPTDKDPKSKKDKSGKN